MRKIAFYIGLTLIAISLIVCIVSFYLLIFGLPTFIVGVILVFFSDQSTKTKLLTTIVPLIAYLPSTYLFLYVYNYSTPKTILIPSEFEGTLRVVYEEKCGRNYDQTDGVKTLTFPENGILILSEDFDSHVNYNYYMVDKVGNRTEIPQILSFREKVQKLPCVLVSGSGTIELPIEANRTNQEEKGITYTDFYVYNKDTVDRNDYKSQQYFDSLTTAIVNQCKQQK